MFLLVPVVAQVFLKHNLVRNFSESSYFYITALLPLFYRMIWYIDSRIQQKSVICISKSTLS